jgi:hypothetical protein
MFIEFWHSKSMIKPDNRLPRMMRLAAVLLMAVCPLPALAALGGDGASVKADSARLSIQPSITALQLYDRHDLITPAGAIHEFVSRSGKVFAVTWNGQAPPDLRQILGSYFGDYRSAVVARTGPGARRHVAIVLPDLVVHAAGRMRAFYGAAYVPSLVPVGFDLSELR